MQVPSIITSVLSLAYDNLFLLLQVIFFKIQNVLGFSPTNLIGHRGQVGGGTRNCELKVEPFSLRSNKSDKQVIKAKQF